MVNSIENLHDIILKFKPLTPARWNDFEKLFSDMACEIMHDAKPRPGL